MLASKLNEEDLTRLFLKLNVDLIETKKQTDPLSILYKWLKTQTNRKVAFIAIEKALKEAGLKLFVQEVLYAPFVQQSSG